MDISHASEECLESHQELVKRCMQTYFNTTDLVSVWKTERIGIDRGNLARISRISLRWSNESSNLPKSVILKVPTTETLDQKTRKSSENVNSSALTPPLDNWTIVDLCRQTEHAFYKFASDLAAETVKRPICYFASTQAPHFLLLEDLCGSQEFRYVDGLTLEQCLQVVETLASLHAFSISHSNWKKIDGLNLPGRELTEYELAYAQQFVNSYLSSSKHNPTTQLGGLISRLPEVYEGMKYETFLKCFCDEFALPLVIVHGDLHIQNMLFDGKEKHKLKAIIDWQYVHTGCLVEDIGRLLYLSSDAQIRRESLTTILRHYYDTLGNRLAPEVVPFTFDVFCESFEHAVPFILTRCLVTLLVNPGMAERLGEDKDKGRRVFVGRLRGALDDCFALIDNHKQ